MSSSITRFLGRRDSALDSKRRLLIVDNAVAQSQRLHWHHFEVHYLQATAPISIRSNGSGCASKSTSLATSLRRARATYPASLSRSDLLDERPQNRRLSVRGKRRELTDNEELLHFILMSESLSEKRSLSGHS